MNMSFQDNLVSGGPLGHGGCHLGVEDIFGRVQAETCLPLAFPLPLPDFFPFHLFPGHAHASAPTHTNIS